MSHHRQKTFPVVPLCATAYPDPASSSVVRVVCVCTVHANSMCIAFLVSQPQNSITSIELFDHNSPSYMLIHCSAVASERVGKQSAHCTPIALAYTNTQTHMHTYIRPAAMAPTQACSMHTHTHTPTQCSREISKILIMPPAMYS